MGIRESDALRRSLMENSPPSQPASLPEVAQILALVNQSPSEFPDKLILLQDTLSSGIERALLKAPNLEHLETVYVVAYELYQAQRYREALPMALQLAISNPKDIRFLFMAGMILQSLNDPLLAATFHACALQVDPTFMPAAFRMAECYTVLGEDEEARALLEVSLDMGRESDEFFELQRLIMERLGQTN
jgi:tetratricopeptide (TPR) repeat protein